MMPGFFIEKKLKQFSSYNLINPLFSKENYTLQMPLIVNFDFNAIIDLILTTKKSAIS